MSTTKPSFVTTGSWQPFPGQEQSFVAAWEEFASWAVSLQGAASGEAILVHDLRAPGTYVSFLGWESLEAIRDWKGHSEFKERMGRVQRYIDKFAPTETEVVARVGGEE